MRRIQSILIPILFLLPACSTPDVFFAPREGGAALSPGGQPAASYTFANEDGTGQLGRLRLWAQGQPNDATKAVDLRVGFELQNLSEHVLKLDTSAVRLVSIDVGSDVTQQSSNQAFAAVSVEGETEVQPHAVGRGMLVFGLPASVTTPDDIRAFTLEWKVVEVDGPGKFRDMTSFTRIQAYADPYPYAYGYPDLVPSPWSGPGTAPTGTAVLVAGTGDAQDPAPTVAPPQAFIPPTTLTALVRPAAHRIETAVLEREPDAQTTHTVPSAGTSATRSGSRISGTWIAPSR